MDSTLLKGLRLLEVLVAEAEPLGISELARRMKLPKSNVHRSIAALREAGYVSFDLDSRRYYPTLKLAQMGHRVNSKFSFRTAALSDLQRLVEQTGESAHFALLDGASVVFLANALPPVAVASVIPDNLALHWEDSAMGVALVAALPQEDRKRLLATTTGSELAAWVEQAAQDGYALIRRHETRRIFELAVPVRSEWDTVIGSVGITGPAMRFSEDRLPQQIEAVRAIARTLFDQTPAGLSETPDLD